MHSATACAVVGTGRWIIQKALSFSSLSGCSLRRLLSIYGNGMLEKNNDASQSCFGCGRIFGIEDPMNRTVDLAATSADRLSLKTARR
jgi:hypothetical protein